MIKYINAHKISKADTKVRVSSFPVTVHLDNADSQNHIDIESSKGENGAAEIICESGRNSHYCCAELESQLKHIETNVNFLMNHFRNFCSLKNLSPHVALMPAKPKSIV